MPRVAPGEPMPKTTDKMLAAFDAKGVMVSIALRYTRPGLSAPTYLVRRRLRLPGLVRWVGVRTEGALTEIVRESACLYSWRTICASASAPARLVCACNASVGSFALMGEWILAHRVREQTWLVDRNVLACSSVPPHLPQSCPGKLGLCGCVLVRTGSTPTLAES